MMRPTWEVLPGGVGVDEAPVQSFELRCSPPPTAREGSSRRGGGPVLVDAKLGEKRHSSSLPPSTKNRSTESSGCTPTSSGAQRALRTPHRYERWPETRGHRRIGRRNSSSRIHNVRHANESSKATMPRTIEDHRSPRRSPEPLAARLLRYPSEW